MHSERYIEKHFIYMIIFSLLLHSGVFAIYFSLAREKKQPVEETVFIDMQDVADPKTEPKIKRESVTVKSDRRVRVDRESAPRPRERTPVRPSRQSASASNNQAARQSAKPSQANSRQTARQSQPVKPGSSVSSLLKSKSQSASQQRKPQLFPGGSSLAGMENYYRRKFEKEVAAGDTLFMDSDDIQFASFLHRLENSIYGVWRYPQAAASQGIEGTTPVKITFNRRGEIIRVKLLNSSGAKILDDEVLRTLGLLGRIGGFPKGYDKEEFNLIAFFRYGASRRTLR